MEEQKNVTRIAELLNTTERKSISSSSILIIGTSSVTFELMTYLSLVGVRSFYVFDTVKNRPISHCTNFYACAFQPTSPCSLLKSIHKNCMVEVETHSEVLELIRTKRVRVVLCIDIPLEEAREYNKLCREESNFSLDKSGGNDVVSVSFIAARYRGLAGYVFVDSGKSYKYRESKGVEDTPKRVLNISQGMVKLLDSISDGDVVEFFRPKDVLNSEDEMDLGDEDLPKGKIMITNSGYKYFNLPPTVPSLPPYQSGAFIKTLPKDCTAHFLPIDDPTHYQDNDGALLEDTFFLLCFHTLDVFLKNKQHYPRSRNEEDWTIFLQYFQSELHKYVGNVSFDKELLQHFCYTCSGELMPMASIIGAIAAQEVLKSLSRKYRPIEGFCIQNFIPQCYIDGLTVEDCSPSGDPMDDQIAIFGRKNQENFFKKAKIIIGGMGAVGCAMLKNMACMGIKNITAIDYDHVSDANLIGQPLFNYKDVKQRRSKVEAAGERLKELHRSLNYVPIIDKIAFETEKRYMNIFQQSDVIISAVDSMACRDYIDEICHRVSVEQGRKLCMLEGGIGGVKGTSVIVVPFEFPSYGESNRGSNDQPSQAACLPKVCLTSARDVVRKATEEFEGYFNKYLYEAQLVLDQDPLESRNLRAFYDHLYQGNYSEWAVKLFQKLFWTDMKGVETIYQDSKEQLSVSNNIIEREMSSLLKNAPKCQEYNPEDTQHQSFIKAVEKVLDESKELTPIPYDKDNELHLNLVFEMSLIYAKLYAIALPNDIEFVRRESGKIISAIVTTTGLVAGSMGMNLYLLLLRNYDKITEPSINTADAMYTLNYPLEKRFPVIEKMHYYEDMGALISPDILLSDLILLIEKKFDTTITPQDSFSLFGGIYQITFNPKSTGANPTERLLDKLSDSIFYESIKPLQIVVTMGLLKNKQRTTIKLVVSLLPHKPFPLENIKGSCYINTLLQLLLCCEDWINELGQIMNNGHLTTLFKDHFPHLTELRKFHSGLETIFGDLTGPGDAEELLQQIWEILRKEQGSDDTVQTFSFQSHNREKCTSCNWTSEWETDDDCINIIYPLNCYIVKDSEKTIQQIYDADVSTHTGKCPKCEENTRFMEVRIDSHKYLFINLVADRSESITLSDTLVILNKSYEKSVYKLQGIGIFNEGHYIALVLNKIGWWRCNDFLIEPMAPPTKLPYVKLLLYQQEYISKPLIVQASTAQTSNIQPNIIWRLFLYLADLISAWPKFMIGRLIW